MFTELEGRLGHQFKQSDLLRIALTHRSYYFENKSSSPGHFERLEFLGDAILDFLLSEMLMGQFPDVEEGTLSKWRASLVNEKTLSEIARELDLAKFLYLGKSEEGQRDNARPRLLASAFEALLAALYTDAGIEAVRILIGRLFSARLSELDAENQYATDFKTRLQEYSQKKYRTTPEYRLLDSTGPEHAKIFRFHVFVDQQNLATGEGSSRKNAEQDAARQALLKIATLQGEDK